MLGEPTKAKEKLGWVAEITVDEMCAEMIQHDLEQAKQLATRFLTENFQKCCISQLSFIEVL